MLKIGNRIGQYYSERRFMDRTLPLAQRLHDHFPGIEVEVFYDPYGDYDHIVFVLDGDHYDIRLYKVWAVCKNNCNVWQEKNFHTRDWEVEELFTRGRYKSWKVSWSYGDNGTQEYFTNGKGFDICRNHGEKHWVIYDHNNGSVMVPNPNESELKLQFVEVTDIPAAGEQFGDRPHHDTISGTSPNYAWDRPSDAREYVEYHLLPKDTE